MPNIDIKEWESEKKYIAVQIKYYFDWENVLIDIR